VQDTSNGRAEKKKQKKKKSGPGYVLELVSRVVRASRVRWKDQRPGQVGTHEANWTSTALDCRARRNDAES
jgi:hypothetical protein